MSNPILIKKFTASGAVAGNRIVKHGAADNLVALAAAATDLLIGVSQNKVDAADTEPVDVILQGLATVKAGGAITRGAKVTSDATGQAVAAAPAAGANNQILGIAYEAAANGDLFRVLINQSVMQG
jgi:hypothetical protein